MRQVGRSVQCRQNRRGRTAATWPYSVSLYGGQARRHAGYVKTPQARERRLRCVLSID